MGYTDGIINVEVAEGDRRYRLTTNAQSEEPFTYHLRENQLENALEVHWFYPPTSNSARTFTLKYTVQHAVRVYPRGDQLWAIAVDGGHASMVYFAKATVRLPADVTAADRQLTSYGAPATIEHLDARTIRFSATRLPPGQRLEVRVQWPHGIITGRKPAWQEREEGLQTLMLWGTLLSVLGLGIGFLGLLLFWLVKGRDPRVQAVAAYLPEPPGDLSTGAGPGLPPALAGLLLDGKTSLRHIVATIVDLSHRGALGITSWGENDYEFKLLWDDEKLAALRPYERDVVEALFSPLQAFEIGASLVRTDLQTRVSLHDVQKTFESYIRPIFAAIAQMAVQEGLFEKHPEATAGRYFGIGMGLLLGAAVALATLFALSPHVLTMLLGGFAILLDALYVFGSLGFIVFASVAFGAMMTALAVIGQFVGRYTWYAALSLWTYVAFAGAALGFGGLGWLLGSLLPVLPPALALIIWSAGLILVSFYMVRTTPQGALQRARWQAFKRYLSQIDLFGDLAAAREIFDRYLPYAIAFGIEKAWVRKFLTVDTPAPTWFIVPALAAHPTGRYLRPGLGPAAPDTVMATASLTGVSDGLFHSLQDVSDGLFNMLGAVSTSLHTGPLKSLDVTGGPGGLGRAGGGWSGGGLGSGGFGGGARGVG